METEDPMRRSRLAALVFSYVLLASCGDEGHHSGGPEVAQSTFQVADGIQVSDLTGVSEGYAVKVAPDGYTVFTVNVSAERLADVFRSLAKEVNGRGFFLLETGSQRDVEEELRTHPGDPFHKDVFYLDGIQVERALEILAGNERNLIHDGGVNFGFGSHVGHDEVIVGPYKIVYIYADDPEKYRRALERLGYPQRETLKTVWDNFGPEAPGQRGILKDARPTRWEMIDALKAQGLYLAERRED